MFAEATGDRQWIHVDPERAAAGPFGSTVAHGYLTLSMLPMLLARGRVGERRCDGPELRHGEDPLHEPCPGRLTVRLHAKLRRRSAAARA